MTQMIVPKNQTSDPCINSQTQGYKVNQKLKTSKKSKLSSEALCGIVRAAQKIHISLKSFSQKPSIMNEEDANHVKDVSTDEEEQDVEQGEDAAPTLTREPSGWRRKLLIIGVPLLAVALVLAIVLPLTLKPVSRTSGLSDSSSNNGGAANSTIPQLNLPDGPFDTNLAAFSQDVTRGYSSLQDLELDLQSAAYFLLNQVTKRNTGVYGYGNVGFGRGFPESMPVNDAAPVDGAAQTPTSAPPVGNNLDDYGTNNQEKNIEEGDLVVSDGTYGTFSMAFVVRCSLPPYQRTHLCSRFSLRRLW
jgi:hypothetical protein